MDVVDDLDVEQKKVSFDVKSVNIVNTAMLVVVMSQMAILSAASSSIGPRRRFIQDLEGQIIHDDGSSVHGRCNEKEFIEGSLKRYPNVI